MKTYLSLIVIDLRLIARQRTVIFFNYLFPLVFFFIFAAIFPVRREPGVMTYVLTMSISLGLLGAYQALTGHNIITPGIFGR